MKRIALVLAHCAITFTSFAQTITLAQGKVEIDKALKTYAAE